MSARLSPDIKVCIDPARCYVSNNYIFSTCICLLHVFLLQLGNSLMLTLSRTPSGPDTVMASSFHCSFACYIDPTYLRTYQVLSSTTTVCISYL